MEVVGNGPADTQGLSVAISLLAVPGRPVGRLDAVRQARRPDLRRARRLQPVPHRLRAGDAHVLADGGAARCCSAPPSCTSSCSAGATTCRSSWGCSPRILYTHSWGIFVTAGHAGRARDRCSCSSDDRRALLKDGRDRLRRRVPALRPVAPHAALPDRHTPERRGSNPPRLGAPVQIAKRAARRRHGDRRARCSRPGRAWPRCSAARSPTGRSARAVLTAAADRRGHARGRVAVLAGLAGLDHALPRRRARARSSCSPPLGLARAGNLGLVALVIVLAHLGGPQDRATWRTSPTPPTSPARWPRTCAAGRPRGDPPARAAAADPLPPAQRPDRGHPARRGARRKGVMDWRDVQDELEDATPDEESHAAA